jgi:hypothetical protein
LTPPPPAAAALSPSLLGIQVAGTAEASVAVTVADDVDGWAELVRRLASAVGIATVAEVWHRTGGTKQVCSPGMASLFAVTHPPCPHDAVVILVPHDGVDLPPGPVAPHLVAGVSCDANDPLPTDEQNWLRVLSLCLEEPFIIPKLLQQVSVRR